ncbi:hypothetical protein GUITHDRAFT_120569 [Guillardia theta CCMP2712]|uniref:Uncharacterized protein n=1 Tax=Guillardia theta (strain CCMP2712) TaxID=905079 RepID=L1IAJ8_GUITC|nr:hypothetical protein GUITHDRAFT_120569 [Guillardia theta CCMP2712]EKX33253.1 hypothetical protein GUITHDRAFT_120569 [Guillardia theta CCMP2712]|eukprot:XP_005820233.1 hypothetical protein GUITHDRAFT_120569 [Guillardia theta CCMP2712]
MAEPVGQDALAAGLAAYGEQEERLRKLMPMGMREIVAAHASAMQAAYAAFDSHSQGAEQGGLQEQRAALEVALCRWKTPTDGVDLASVVEVSEGGVRLVKVNEVVDGRAAELVKENWRALVAVFEMAWEESYKPIQDKVQAGNKYASVDDFDSELEAAKKKAEERVQPFQDEFKLFRGLASHQERVQRLRSKVQEISFERRLAEQRQTIKQELMEVVSATKDAQRRELKLVLDRVRNMEERMSEVSAKMGQSDENLQALEKKIDKKFRDSSLATCITKEMKSALDVQIAEQASALEALRAKMLDATLNSKEEIDTVQAKITELHDAISRLTADKVHGRYASSSRLESDSRYLHILWADVFKVAENCKAMFGILEEQAERQGPLAELNQKISQVESEVGGIATRIEQGRDEIQALFGMIAELPQGQSKSKFLPESAKKFLKGKKSDQ